MKKYSFIPLVICSLGLGLQLIANKSFAQQLKSCDLSFKIVSPVNDSIYSTADTAKFFLMVKNNGPDNISANDTIRFSFTLVHSYFPPQNLPIGDSVILGPIASVSMSGLDLDEIDTQRFCSQLENAQASTFTDPDSSNNKNCVRFYFKDNPNTGIQNIAVNPLELYPNPSTGLVTIKGNAVNDAKSATLAIYDQLGRIVLKKTFTNLAEEKDVNFDVSTLPEGIYVVKLMTANTQRQGKLIIR